MIWRRPRSVPRRSASRFHEAVHHAALEVFGARAVGQLEPGIADCVVDAVDVDRVAHDRVADAIASAGAGLVADEHDLRLGELHARRAGGNRGVEIEVLADLLRARHLDLAERHADAERGRAVGHAHGIVHLAGDVLAARFRVAHGIDGQQRRLGLHVVHVLRIVDAGVAHRGFDGGRDLLDHGRPADILRQQLRAQRGADRQARFRRWAGLAVAREHRRMRRDDAVAAARPDHRDVRDLGLAALAELLQHAAKRLVGENAREIVDAAIAFGLADDRDHLVGAELALGDARLQAGGVLHGLELDLRDLDRHSSAPYTSLRMRGAHSPRSICS